MSPLESAQQALELTSLDLPSSLPVVGIHVELDEDSTGDEALRVYVILPDDTSDESLSGEHVLDLKRTIRNRLMQRGVTLFPYVYLRTQSEWHEEVDAKADA